MANESEIKYLSEGLLIYCHGLPQVAKLTAGCASPRSTGS